MGKFHRPRSRSLWFVVGFLFLAGISVSYLGGESEAARPALQSETRGGDKPRVKFIDNSVSDLEASADVKKMDEGAPRVKFIPPAKVQDSSANVALLAADSARQANVLSLQETHNNQEVGGFGGKVEQLHFKNDVKSPVPDQPGKIFSKQIIVHFDLKGAPPKVDFIINVLQLSKSLGATGILMEWEDMFPYEGELKSVSAPNHYSLEEVNTILEAATRLGLTIIPLVQTFGHVEFALKLERFAALRELPKDPQALCPSKKDSLKLIMEVIDQTMKVHAKYNPTHLHIGCDEVFHMGECPVCRQKSRNDLFLSHVKFVAEYVVNKHSVIPIIWDDMLRQMSPIDFEAYKLGDLVEPMVWVYAEDVYRFVPPTTWDVYAQAFKNVWGASTFKGAFGETLVVPPLRRHLDNNLMWLDVFHGESPKFHEFKGIVLTGWQRYDHFAVLCELLPAGIPSLALSLLALTSGKRDRSLIEKTKQALSCASPSVSDHFSLESDENLYGELVTCRFPGHEFYKATRRLKSLEDSYELQMSQLRKKGWYTDYNLRNNFTAPMRINEVKWQVDSLVSEVEGTAQILHSTLSLYFDSHTVGEYLEQKVYGMWKEVTELRDGLTAIAERDAWHKRPIAPSPEVQKFLQRAMRP